MLDTNAVPPAEPKRWLERTLLPGVPWLTYEALLFALVILLAVGSRFYDLGTRAMSHDESLHTTYSWQLYKGTGYQHNPMMHGPFQFHIMALSYFLFGVSDATARVPAAVFSLLMIWMAWYWRRYLGRAGAIAAAVMLLISPYLLYYGRYAREDAYVLPSAILLLYATLRYLETGEHRYIYWFSGAFLLHFLTKETSYIYAAQMLVFLAVYFVIQVVRKAWAHPEFYRPFLIALIVGALLLVSGVTVSVLDENQQLIGATETAAPLDPTAETALPAAPLTLSAGLVLGLVGLLALAAALYFGVRGFTLGAIRAERSFDLLIFLGATVLPLLAAFPVHVVGWNPLDYTQTGMLRTALFLVPLALIGVAVGWWWNPQVWAKASLIFWGPFIAFYTTFFTNGQGFFTGLVGSLGYWLEQHGVERGSQPLYYYVLLQIPIYEFLPALGSLLALFFALRRKGQADSNRTNVLALLGFWSLASIFTLSWAGEKMPWLTVHMALPLVLLAGWGIGQLVEAVDWEGLKRSRPLPVLAVLIVFLASLIGTSLALMAPTPPFQGQELTQLQSTANFIMALVGLIASAAGLYALLKDWDGWQAVRLGLLLFFGLLAVLTARAAIRASYINYDNAKEYLVYAHSYSGVKEVMAQVDEISERLTGGKAMVVGYDDDVPWPLSWYLRDYPNARYFGGSPTRDLREVPVLIVGDNNFGKIEPVTGDAYYMFEYIRMVWPNQDYFNLTWERLRNALVDRSLRAAIFDVWLNRDFSSYATAVEPFARAENPYFNPAVFTLEQWSPADHMRLYIRKDVAAKIWNYGVGPTEAVIEADPYEKGIINLAADVYFGSQGSGDSQFNAPRGLAAGPDGSIYVADSRNHRIQRFSAEGELIGSWGTFMDAALQTAGPGVFNEPWGVAVASDGSVYVTDTWNHRIQKFSADGTFIKAWGRYGLAETPDAFWGPRGIAVDSRGRVYVADTGNKRIVVFDKDGNYITSFGREGIQPGEFAEPVGVALDAAGNVYVTDTWNQRIQVLAPSVDGLTYLPLYQWDVSAWYGQSVDNKPFIAVNRSGHVFITDPEAYRVLEFNGTGEFVRTWGTFSTGPEGIALGSGIAVDAAGHIWVSDAGNARILRFTLP